MVSEPEVLKLILITLYNPEEIKGQNSEKVPTFFFSIGVRTPNFCDMKRLSLRLTFNS